MTNYYAVEPLGFITLDSTEAHNSSRRDHPVDRHELPIVADLISKRVSMDWLSVTGRTRLTPLVDLALLAIELGDYLKARNYALEACLFNPS